MRSPVLAIPHFILEIRMRFIPLLRALVVLAAFPFAAARAQDKVVINADNAKMHEQPSMTAPGKPVTRGTALIVLERNGTWITVFDGRVQGFVHAALVVPVAPPTPQATPVPPAAPMYPPQATPMYPPQATPMYPPQGTPAAQPYGTGAVGVGGKSGQVRFPGTPGYKDGTTARVLGLLIPGGEAFYTGQTSKGIFKAALGYGALIVLPTLVAQKEVSDCTSAINNGNFNFDDYTDDCNATSVGWTALAGWGTYMAMVVHGVVTGGSAADAANRRPMYGMSPIIRPARHGGTMLGLRVPTPAVPRR